MPRKNVLSRSTNSPTSGDTEPEYDFSKQVGHLLRKAYQWHIAIFQKFCADPQLTAAQFAVLCTLRDKGASSLTQIGSKIVMDPATTRGIVERLKERKLVLLTTDKKDRRRVIVSLTEQGRRLLTKVVPSAIAITDRTLQSLNAAERLALLYLLNKLGGNGSSEEKDVATALPSVDAGLE